MTEAPTMLSLAVTGTHVNNPYHNVEHCKDVLHWCEAIITHEQKVVTDQLRWAALFHDFNHTGGAQNDNENIFRAVAGFNTAFDLWSSYQQNSGDTPKSLVRFRQEVIDIIRCTKFIRGEFPCEPVTFEQQAIRDADLMSIYLPTNRALGAMNGLYAEIKGAMPSFTKEQFWESNISFLNNATYYTKFATMTKLSKLDSALKTVGDLFLETAE